MGKSIRALYKVARKAGTYLALSGLVLQAPMMTYAADTSSAFNNISLTRAYKALNQNNPIVTQKYSADPGVMVYGDTVYIYTTSDEVVYENGSVKENTYGHIKTLNCFSSKDLVNWTDHGVIQVAGSNGVAKWANWSWAPYAVSKNINGKDKFFLYFANNACGIGVLEADSPTGPWRDPVGKALIPNCPGVPWCFDPAVLVDDDGTGYLYFGGGIDNSQYAHPKSARVVKLGDDMVSLAGTPVTIDAPYMFEDSGINKIGNKYYYSYCSNFNTIGSGIGGGCIEYMVSNSPMGPFTYAGEVFKNPAVYFSNSGGNNHHTIFKFKDNYYLAYHTKTLQAAQFGGDYGYRNTHIDKLTVNNGALLDVKGTMTGVSQVDYVNPYSKVQAETMAIQAGVNVTGQGDTKVTDISRGDWIGVKGVDFSEGLSKLTVSAQSNTGGYIKVCTGSPSGETLGYIEVPNTGNAYKEVSGTLTNTSGVKDLYFVFSNNMALDYWYVADQAGNGAPSTPSEPVVTPNNNYVTLKDGWYYIKNVGAQKYLQIAGNKGDNAVNVEIGIGTGDIGQRWYLTNRQNGYMTLKNGHGYTLDVVYGKDEDKANIQIYTANGLDAQQFKVLPTPEKNVYGIVTKCSTDVRGLDVEDKATIDGANVQQYFYYGGDNQKWIFESCDAPGAAVPPTENPTEPPATTPSSDVMSVKLTSDWGDGAVADFTITNTTGTNLENWTCTFTTNRPITSIWNATIVSQEGNTYTITGPTWQPGLAAGASYTFGGQLGSGASDVTISDVTLK